MGFEDRPELFAAKSDEEFREAVTSAVRWRDDFTKPEDGWPWAWKDSNTTDYAYAIDDGTVYASCFGRPWFVVDPEADNYGEPEKFAGKEGQEFPDMSERMNVRYDQGSGLIVMHYPAPEENE